MNRGALPAAAALLAAALLTPSPAPARDELEIALHHGYGTPRAFVLEGRVAERRRSRAPRPEDSWARNLWRRLRALVSDEEKNVGLRLALGGTSFASATDDEGYFLLRAPTPPGAAPGWNAVLIETADGTARTEERILILPPENTIGIISDVDDTVVVSEVPERLRLLRHVLLQNYLQREPVAGMAALFRSVTERNPRPGETAVVYLTAAPRQLVPAIRAFLERNGFPPGPVVAKKVSDGARDPLLDQEAYKGAKLEAILADLAPARFVLVGDDGERDPEIYRAARERHPGRVEAVWIRRVGADPWRLHLPGQEDPPLAGASSP